MGSIENTEGIVVQRTRQVLVGVPNWGAAVVIGMFDGMLYGGSKEASASSVTTARFLLKNFIQSLHLHGSIVVGVRLGMFNGCFCGLQNLLAEKRGVHDVLNVVVAGSGTAATFGLILPGSLMWRLRNVMLGSVMGAAICFPLGWLHLKLVEKANEGSMVVAAVEAENTTENKSNIGAAVD